MSLCFHCGGSGCEMCEGDEDALLMSDDYYEDGLDDEFAAGSMAFDDYDEQEDLDELADDQDTEDDARETDDW